MSELLLLNERHDYSRLGLNGNPFPAVAIAEESPTIFYNQRRAISQLRQVLSYATTTGKSAHAAVVGAYGSGKSHTLRYLCNRVSAEGRSQSLCVYIDQPGDSVKDLYAKVIRNLGFDFLSDLARTVLGVEVERNRRGNRRRGAPNPARGWKAIDSGRVLISDILPESVRRLSTQCGYPDFAKALLGLAFEESALASWDWLSAHGVDHHSRQVMEIRANLRPENVITAFNALRFVLRVCGHPNMTVFLDELEAIEALTNLTKQRFLNDLRHIIDTNPRGLCLVMACAPEVWQTIASEYHAFAERISKCVVLTPLDRRAVEELILSYVRLVSLNGTSEELFDHEVLTEIAGASGGNVRHVLALGNLCVENAVALGKRRIDTECLPDLS